MTWKYATRWSREHEGPPRWVLMTKFGKSGKLEYPVCLGISSFGSFRAKPTKELSFKIQGVLKQEKGLKGIKEPR
jgi:hypothetical protein